jgi:tRNA-dihydrouridine synthase B
VINIGPYKLANSLFLAPMVGVSDKPFREICSEQGAGLTIAEMLTSNTEHWHSEKNRLRREVASINGPRVIQIAGSDPELMATAAKLNADLGAEAIDINMGCPAKKVLKKSAGSALLKDCAKVTSILKAVVARVDIPVTLKIRTGWCPSTRNGVEIARIAEDCGIQLLTVHGRTRECRFRGLAEYDTIAAIKQAVQIPVVANGDIDSAQKAAFVLNYTQADGLMIGRAAQGRPWIFEEISHFLATGSQMHSKPLDEMAEVIATHLNKLYHFYGEVKGVWYARKHVASYVKQLPGGRQFLTDFHRCQAPQQQTDILTEYFSLLTDNKEAIAA